MKRFLTLTAMGIVATVAYAASMEGAQGRGVAVNGDGVRGHFEFHVRKYTSDARQVRVVGGGKFGILSDVAARRVSITYEANRFIRGNANNAEFSGPAVRVLFREGQRIPVRGFVVVKIQDNRRDIA